MAKKQAKEPTASEVDTLLEQHRATMNEAERKEFDEFFEAMTIPERVEFMESLAKKGTADWSGKDCDPVADVERAIENFMNDVGVTVTQVEPVSGEQDPFLGASELARMFSTTPTTIIRWVRIDGWLPYFEVGPHRHIKVRKSVADAQLKTKKQNLVPIRLPNETSLTSLTQNK